MHNPSKNTKQMEKINLMENIAYTLHKERLYQLLLQTAYTDIFE